MAKTREPKKRQAADQPAGANKRVNAPVGTTNKKRAAVANTSARRTAPPARTATNNQPPSKELEVFVFGQGDSGELGLGAKNATGVTKPRLNANLSGVVDIAAGGMHGAALTKDNRLLTWGVNDHSALGRDTTWDGVWRDAADADGSDSDEDEEEEEDVVLNPLESTPTAVPADTLPDNDEIAQVVAGDSATFILTRSGLVYGMGTFRDNNGIFGFGLDQGTGRIVSIQSRLAQVRGLKDIKMLSAGADFALALNTSGQVFAWGSGQQGQLGRRIVERRRSAGLVPQSVGIPRSRRIVSIHAAIDHAFAIQDTGDVWTWGSNNFGQTGISTGAGQDSTMVVPPQKVTSLQGRQMRIIAGGRHHSIGVTRTGECLVWGRMDGGQMGMDFATLPIDDPSKILLDARGKPRILLQPTAVPLPECTYATAGTDHCIAITADGNGYSWGFNDSAQCGQGNDDDIPVAKLMEKGDIVGKTLSWAGAGGQYSMVASGS